MAMTNQEWHGVSRDDFAEALFDLDFDNTGAHYMAARGDKATAKTRLLAIIGAWLDVNMYRATSYGTAWAEENDEEDV